MKTTTLSLLAAAVLLLTALPAVSGSIHLTPNVVKQRHMAHPQPRIEHGKIRGERPHKQTHALQWWRHDRYRYGHSGKLTHHQRHTVKPYWPHSSWRHYSATPDRYGYGASSRLSDNRRW